MDLEGSQLAVMCVSEIQFIFSKAIPADIVVLPQRPFAMDSWRQGPNPGEVECVVIYKVGSVL